MVGWECPTKPRESSGLDPEAVHSLPQESTARRWRREVSESFRFTVKAWQAITHPWNSPTWNGHRDAVPDDRTDEVGYCRPTPFVQEAWDRTRAIADALDADVILLQTPPSFDCSADHEQHLRSLVDTVDRADLDLAWEPRGDWPDHPDRVAAICADLDLVPVVDLLRDDPIGESALCYLSTRRETRPSGRE